MLQIDEMSKNVKQKLKNKKSQEQLRKEDGDEVLRHNFLRNNWDSNYKYYRCLAKSCKDKERRTSL